MIEVEKPSVAFIIPLVLVLILIVVGVVLINIISDFLVGGTLIIMGVIIFYSQIIRKLK